MLALHCYGAAHPTHIRRLTAQSLFYVFILCSMLFPLFIRSLAMADHIRFVATSLLKLLFVSWRGRCPTRYGQQGQAARQLKGEHLEYMLLERLCTKLEAEMISDWPRVSLFGRKRTPIPSTWTTSKHSLEGSTPGRNAMRGRFCACSTLTQQPRAKQIHTWPCCTASYDPLGVQRQSCIPHPC